MTPEQRAAITAAYERMLSANQAITDAPDGADLDALQAGFTEARSAHVTAKAAGERADMLEQAKRELPVEPVVPAEDKTPTTDVSVRSEPVTYHAHAEHSFFADQVRAMKGDRPAQERLQRHMREMVTEGIVADAEQRAIAESAGAGGELIAPLYLQDQFLTLARAGRAYVDALSTMDLPAGVNTINIPRLVSGAATATQQDLGAVQSTDITTGNLPVPVITVAGQQDLARQLYDRAFPGVDQILFADLIADYNTRVDAQALNGSGVGGNAKGVLNVAGVNASTYTSASPTIAGLYSKIADVIQQIHTTRFLPPSVIVMHPRRWAWFLAASDSSGRPLVTPYPTPGPAVSAMSQPANQPASFQKVASQALVGSLQGLPVIVDPMVPINLGAGTNEDRIIVQRIEDSWLLEDSPIKTRVFEEVLSNVLAIRVQVFNYLALTHERYPKAIGIVSGTGLVTPTF